MIRRFGPLIIIVGILLDQFTKYFAQQTLSMFRPLKVGLGLSLQLVHNYGAAYGIFQNQRYFLLLISGIVILFLIFFWRKLGSSVFTETGVAFLFAGTIGNFLDRLYLGYVIDFIDIQIFPVFNFADIFIDIGIACLIIDMLFPAKKEI
jgi:signal peptidase II